jgi:hypothetical protein
MAIRSFRSREFRRCLEALPEDVQALAYENFLLWKRDPGHPSLKFKKVSGENWSARVGIRYRAMGRFVKDGFLWEWIGTHGEYDRLA